MSKYSALLAIAIVFAFTPASVMAELILHLPFEEAEGAIVEDASSRGNNGEIMGSVERVDGREGNGRAVEILAGGYIDVPEIPEYDVTSDVSVLAWIKVTNVTTWARLIDKSQWQTTGFDLALSQVTHAPLFEFFVADTTSQALATTPVDDGVWHFVAGTFGDKTLRIYVDGVMEQEVLSTNEHNINPNDFPIRLGREAHPGMGQQYVGVIDEVAIFDHALPEEDVARIFDQGIQPAAVRAQGKMALVWAQLRPLQ